MTANHHFLGEHIQRLSPQGLWYVDNNGKEHFIDFELCYENYIQIALSPQKLAEQKRQSNKSESAWEQYVQRLTQLKYIGDRNILTPPWAQGPYIEFFTLPPVRFRFETLEQFERIRIYLERCGWRTGDRS